MEYGALDLFVILVSVVLLLALRQLPKSERRRASELTSINDHPRTSRTEDASEEEIKALRWDSASTSKTDDESGEENEALRRDAGSTSRRDHLTTSKTDNALGVENEALRRDSESTLRMDNVSGEENEAFRRDLEATSRRDDVSGEGNEAFNASGIEYDVFLSFRGRDTRDNFTDCLYHRLRLIGLHVFLDNEELRVGTEIDGELSKALDKSRIYIPIFSQNYATSSWCLREVAHMEKCTSKSNRKKEILPIFYDVDPDDVKLNTELYKNAMPKHEEKFGVDELKRWEASLRKVARLKGWDLKRKSQGELIDSVVEEVLWKLNSRNVDVPKYLIEDHPQIKAITEKLKIDSNGVRFLGIHGGGGIGKTVLARVVFNRLSHHFDGVSFLKEVRESSKHGLIDLQKKLLSSFVGFETANKIEDIEDGVHWIKKVCNTKKVLIVLDDLDKKEQLEKLAGESDWFGSGSRIIITTRDKSILMTQVESSSEEGQNQTKGILAYEVHEMEYGRALQLFCKHAFRRDSPVKGYDHLAEKIVCRVGMLPLAIEVIGSSLYSEGLVLEQHLDKIELWEDTLKQLDEGPYKDVRDALIISYEQLEPKHKEVFLDIACFFTNADLTYPIIMWRDCNYYPPRAISALLLRSLMKIRDDKTFWMHDQVRDLGRYIVLQEYPCKENPHKFSRVWNHEDAIKLLEMKETNRDVQALSLTSDGCSHNFAAEELAALPKLRFLRVKESNFSGNFQNVLPELRWLSWQTWKITFRAKNFHFSNLVVLDLSNSFIRDDWGGWSQMKMNKLKVLDLTGCLLLKRTPDFSNFASLEMLILARCVRLTTIHSSISKLKLLKILNIEGCKLLRELPAQVGSLQSLTEIIMPQNFEPFKLPETFGNLESLSSFILDGHLGINQLPSYIGGLVKVTRLSLRWCVGIKKLPCSLGKMKMLDELDLSMSGIAELPDSIEYLKKLKVIRVSCTEIKKFPHTIGQVEMLEELHAQKCWDLTNENLEELGKLSNLRILDLSYTSVSRLPKVLCYLSYLQTLEMSSTHLQEVPNLLSSLTHLHLQARHFPSINDPMEEPNLPWTNYLPEKQWINPLPSGLSTLKLRGIKLLPPLSNLRNLSILCVIEYPMPHFSISQELINLTELKLSKCEFLAKIRGLSFLKNLERLDLNRLESLVEIHGLSELESLLHFRISHCRIKNLPNLSKLDKLEHIEVEACPNIRVIEGVKGLESLELDNNCCTVLERLLDVSRSTWLSHRVPKCQVFLSFSGLQTPYSIVDFLYKDLVHNQISVFRDYELSFNDGIGGELPLALNDSDIYIPILSKNYASNGWCLRELTHMVEHASKSYGKKRILPIFYDVGFDDVMLYSNLYKSVLDKHRRKFGNEVEEWERALREVADMTGFHLKSNSHGGLIELVVEEVLRELRGKHVDVRKPLVENHPQIKNIIELLDVDSGGVRFLGIHGVGGSGKTILAKVVFDNLSSHFDGFSFLKDIEASSKSHDGLLNLQKKLLSSFVSSGITGSIKDVDIGIKMIKRVFSGKKVLVVLDNLDKREQLEKLAGRSNWFGSGSRILITTRDKAILMTSMSSSKEVLNHPEGILAYEAHEIEFARALHLFYEHTFRSDSPSEVYVTLSKDIVHKGANFLLAVEMIGPYLFHYGIALQHPFDERKLWEKTLRQLDDAPFKDVQDALMISYDGLKKKEKEVFLDIACFFAGKDNTYPIIMWDDCNYCPHNAIVVLRLRSLIKIGDDNKFWMHDQVRDLGRHIVLEEYPHKLSRVWIYEDAIELLDKKEVNGRIRHVAFIWKEKHINFLLLLYSYLCLNFLSCE
ncbi:disease resistance protein RUN1 [Eucalyptus grandis]|uniref:disease resistance protein RUN1 n=1 Tax=Eucalyptus grandis TaxID=71139 RepID=UPI00192EB6CF|nr:disease resistance protein RUN1 [Eucalyptus grandis]